MPVMILLSIIGLALTVWAHYKVNANFEHWSTINSSQGLTGEEVARKILNDSNLHNVNIESVQGSLTDHYDPTTKTVRLSEPVYRSASIAAIAVAAHECGHALQHAQNHGALTLRHNLVPVLNITSGLAPFLLMAGILMQMGGLFLLGILFFAGTVFFHLITLPVEFDASSKAKKLMQNLNLVSHQDSVGINKVLGAAAFTYVAGALVAVMELIRYIFLYASSQRDND